ncbi:hypothetical protein [Nocardia cyriacigeorgica]|uniref:hypothetical protein n=1 Tax=Nocardia cyriacigeorgica TaxID=135487 RepID=UPI001894D52F|nr:hypothetical protein [Nocardia cyriacigeorgica]MBF6455770.1 hypothetical protein [Nocardia cyriacigeorgica]
MGADVGGDFGGVVGGELFGAVADGVGEAVAGGFADAVGEPALAAQPAGDGAADRPTGGGLPDGGEVVAGQFAIAFGGLDQADTEVESAFFEGAEGGFFDHAGQDALQQLPHGQPDRGLGGDAGGGAGGGSGGGADTGGHGGQRCGHFDGEDHQLGDDHQFGVFDVVGAVVDQVGLVFQQPGQGGEGAVVVAEFFPERLDRIGGLPVQRGQELVDLALSIVTEIIEGGGGAVVGVGHAPHRGLIALGPITGPHDILRGPLQRLWDFDSHPGAPPVSFSAKNLSTQT